MEIEHNLLFEVYANDFEIHQKDANIGSLNDYKPG